jgi:PAS domain S-box-containing protein
VAEVDIHDRPRDRAKAWFLTGEMGRLIAAHDWSDSGLGPLSAWPSALKHAVGLILGSAFPMFILWGERRILLYNQGYADLLGRFHPSALGRSFLEIWPDIAPILAPIVEKAFVGDAPVFRDSRIVFDPASPGEERWLTFAYSPVPSETHPVPGVLCVCIDVTERVLSGRDLADREAHLRLAMEAGQIAPWIVYPPTRTVVSSPELNRMLGLDEDAEPTLEELLNQYLPGERERLDAEFAAMRRRGGQYFETEYRHVRAGDGELRWLLIRAHVELGDDGEPVRIVGVVMDVTERKRAEERLLLLAREVDHRANNLLAVVQGIIRITKAEDIETFRDSLFGRISALGHAHRLISESRWQGASLLQLIGDELGPYMSADQIRFDVLAGDVELSPSIAQGVAMAVHELATNATKHGALTEPSGRVRLRYDRPAKDIARLVWEEIGGPQVHAPSKSGVGISVLERALGGATGGSVELDWRPEGLVCTLEFPAFQR